MRRYVKKRLLEIINTFFEAENLIEINIEAENFKEAKLLIADLQENIILFGDFIESQEDNRKLISCLEDLCELLVKCYDSQSKDQCFKICENINLKLNFAMDCLQRDYIEDKLEIAFMPYKADMWTSMESIWAEAMKDSESEVYVVPIPYFDISTLSNVSFEYEVTRFPTYVKCTHFEEYLESERHPDIIVIHNPYDDYNNLTRVPERFFSKNLKENTDMLVYTPYYTVGAYNKKKHDIMYMMPGTYQADYIVAQSEKVKEIFVALNHSSEKILTYGSPKIDAVIKAENRKIEIPEKWKKKIKGNKIFLLNTHLSYFPQSFTNTNKFGNYAVKFHNRIINTFLNREDCTLIWRPHPLLKSFVKGKFPECMEYINFFESAVKNASNGIVDDLSDYFISFSCSDALISTWSSLINEYMVTGKPILIFQTRMREELAKASPINCNKNYFLFGENGITFTKFREKIIQGIDEMYDERMKEVESDFPNLDGNAGKKVYHFLKEKQKEVNICRR